jgi:hypothetical protein
MGRVVTLQLSSWRETANLPDPAHFLVTRLTCLLLIDLQVLETTVPFADAIATIFLEFLERVNSGARLFQGYGGSCRGSSPFGRKKIMMSTASSILMTKQRCGYIYIASGLALAATNSNCSV